MSNSKRTDFKISRALYIYIIYILLFSLTDIISLPLFYLNEDRFQVIVILASLFFSLGVAYFFAKHCKFKQGKFNKNKIAYWVLIFLIAFLRSLAPDTSNDVSMARVYWQTPGFVDNINENVFPAGFTFFFPLSDRLFYYPRILLGYRMGTLFNAMLVMLIFGQMCELYEQMLGDQLQELRAELAKKSIGRPIFGILTSCMNKEFFAFITISLYYVLADLGTYMIDLVAIPLLLWMLNQISSPRQYAAQQPELLFVALICGLIFALKFTNIIFIVPMLVVYLWKNRNAIHLRVFLVAIVLGILPYLPYFIYAYTSTGNPVYWTFNAIFKSPYYPDVNFKDTRWGPQNWKEFIFWPLHLIIHPTQNVSEISKWPQIYLFMGYIGAGYALIKSRFIKHKSAYVMIASMFFVFTLLWLKSTGYPRYAIICEMLAVFLILMMIVELLQSNSKWKCAISIALLTVLTAQCALNTVGAALNMYDWSFREQITRNSLSGSYKLNSKYVFRDQGNIGTEEQRGKIDIFLSTHVRHAIMRALDENARIINGTYIANDLSSVKESKKIDYPAYYFDMVANAEKSGAGIYDVAIANEYGHFTETANMVGAEIISMEEVHGYYVGRDTPILIGYSMTGRENTCTDLSECPTFTFEQGTKKIDLSGIACLPSYVQWDCDNPILQVTATVEGQTTELLELEIPQHEYIQLDEVLDIAELSKKGDVTITLQDISGQQITGNIFNLSVVSQSEYQK